MVKLVKLHPSLPLPIRKQLHCRWFLLLSSLQIHKGEQEESVGALNLNLKHFYRRAAAQSDKFPFTARKLTLFHLRDSFSAAFCYQSWCVRACVFRGNLSSLSAGVDACKKLSHEINICTPRRMKAARTWDLCFRFAALAQPLLLPAGVSDTPRWYSAKVSSAHAPRSE